MTDVPRVLLCDLDGVVWLAHRPIPGSVEAVRMARQAGMRVLFVTNNSRSTRAEQERALAAVGIEAGDDVLTSSMATARLIEPGWRVLVCGGEGLMEAVSSRGATAVSSHGDSTINGTFDAVVVGMHFEFDYDGLRAASAAVRSGALFLASNTDATYPTEHGEIPGGGAIVAAIEKASGVSPVVAGKPHSTMVDAVREFTGVDNPDEMVMVGDRPETDGTFARNLGCRYALVLSGVTRRADGVDADIVAADLGEVVERLIGRGLRPSEYA